MDHHDSDLTDVELANLRRAAAALAAQLGSGVARHVVVGLAGLPGRPLVVYAPEAGTSGPVLAVVGATRAGRHPAFASLTPRERQVAELLAAGSPNRAIAGRLGITEGTVKDHVHRVLHKTGLASRTAVAAAWRGAAG